MTTSAQATLSGKTILVVDDERFSRVLFAGMLVKLGGHSLEARDGAEALAILQGKDGAAIDCVIADFSMPRMNGLELLKAIRTGQANIRRNLRLMMVTANTERRLVGAALALDVDAFLIKPVTLGTLSQRLARVLSDEFPPRAPEDYAFVATELGGGTPDSPVVRPQVKGLSLPLDQVTEGAVTAAEVTTRKGVRLLDAGVVLNARTLQSLRDIQGEDDPIDAVWVL